jgi:hypothetical protein
MLTNLLTPFYSVGRALGLTTLKKPLSSYKTSEFLEHIQEAYLTNKTSCYLCLAARSLLGDQGEDRMKKILRDNFIELDGTFNQHVRAQSSQPVVRTRFDQTVYSAREIRRSFLAQAILTYQQIGD